MYRGESCTVKKADHQRIDVFKLWCWRRLLRVPWTPRGSNQSMLKEIKPECSLEGLMLKLKLQYFGHLIGKDPDVGKDWGQEEKGVTEDEMVGWHHWFSGRELGQTPGDGEGQGDLACCSPWCCSQTWLSDWTTTTMQCNIKAFHHISHLTGVKIDSIVHWYYENVFSFFNFYLFLLGCAMSLLLHVGFVWLQRAEGGRKGLLSSCSVQSYCGGFSSCWTRPLGTQASVVVMHRLSCPGACGIFLARGQTGIPCLALNHWTTKKVPWKYIFIHSFSHQKSIEYLVYVKCWILEENKNNSPSFWDYL